MLGDIDKDVEIAWRASPQTRLAFTGKPDPRSGFHANGNVDGKRAFLRYPS